MKLNLSRTASFLIIAVVYALAIASSVVVYNVLPLPFYLSILIADIVGTVVTFAFSCVFKNASVYDPYWSVQPVVILIALCFSTPLFVAQILPLIAICIWGTRLTLNWAYTFKGLAHQDWRYTMLSQTTGKFYPIVNFLGIHLFPTLVVYACVMPAVFVFVYNPLFNAVSIIFFILSLSATLLQGVADCQMHSFRKTRPTPFIRIGLWKYSRHPNYLGEILFWWGIGLFAVLLMPDKWWLLSGALLNTLMFFCVSIPLAEKHNSKRDGFEEYKKQTRVILPIYKRYK